jgi:hypothetical protein
MIYYEYINRLEQFGNLDIDLVIYEDESEVKRIHKCFKKVYDEATLEAEALKEIGVLEQVVQEEEIMPAIDEKQLEIDDLKDKVSILTQQVQLLETKVSLHGEELHAKDLVIDEKARELAEKDVLIAEKDAEILAAKP